MSFGSRNRLTLRARGRMVVMATSVAAALVALPTAPARAVDARSVTIDGTVALGTAAFRAQGFLHGLNTNTNTAKVSALTPQNWRVSNNDNYDRAKSYGAKVTWVVSDSCTKILGPVTYQNCVANLVSGSISGNRPVDYWDVWNEPDHEGVLTSAQILDYFRITINQIRAIDPNAKIEGPSLAVYDDSGACNKIDLKCFLDYILNQQLKVDVLSWHEIIDKTGAQVKPTDIGAHITAARALVAARPGLLNTNPLYHVGEYSDSQNYAAPGWTVAWMRYLEENDVDAGIRACWDATEAGTTYSTCSDGLDGLLARDNTTERPIYWVHRVYAGLKGSRVATSHSNTDTVAYGAKDPTHSELGGLIGRWSVGTVNPAANVTVTMKVPYALSQMHLTVYRFQNGVFTQPSPLVITSNQLVSVTSGQVVFTLSNFVDGDAYSVELVP